MERPKLWPATSVRHYHTDLNITHLYLDLITACFKKCTMKQSIQETGEGARTGIGGVLNVL